MGVGGGQGVTAPLVGIDLGGTSIRAAVATGPGAHGTPVHRDTPAEQGAAAILDACADAVREATGGQTPEGAAIGIPGPLNPDTGVVSAAPNLRGLEGVNARDELSKRLHCPVAIQNDARIAGYAEWTLGAGRGTTQFIFITVSTGIGGALVLNGVPHQGAAATAGEVGHMAAGITGPACGQGHPGCLQGVASGTAIAHEAAAAVRSGTATSLRSVPLDTLSAVDVQTAAHAGDELACELFGRAGHALGRGVGTLVNVLSPEVFAIGGGLIHAGDLLFAPMRKGVREIAFEEPLARCRITTAALGTDAGLAGAVEWAVLQFGTTVPSGPAQPPPS
jgi:glucokinase